jgi:chitin disaccharide deacetylase
LSRLACQPEGVSEARFLIVNADDLGMTEAVNDGIFQAHEHGIVTSASLMVGRPAAREAVDGLIGCPDLAVGLHLELGEEELPRQLERFRELVGRDPTHVDSHKHVHETEPEVGVAAEALAAELGVPLRNRGIRYEGGFYGEEAISPQRLIELIEQLPPGWTEIGCHPAAGSVPTSSYDAERQVELRTLCEPRVRRALGQGGVILHSFRELR